MVERVFLEFLPFICMKVCLQCAVSKTLLSGVVLNFEILQTVIFSWALFCQYFLVTAKGFAMPDLLSETNISN